MAPNIREEEISENEDDLQDSNKFQPERVIILLDLDCFEVQLWLKHNDRYKEFIEKDVPIVVVNLQGIILSVNYTAKTFGVKRGKGRAALTKARETCENQGVKLVEIVAKERYGKSDSFLLQKESDAILKCLQNYQARLRNKRSITIERTCKDEFYIDVTKLVKQRIQTSNSQRSKGELVRIPEPWKIKMLLEPKVHPNGLYKGKSTTIMEGRKTKISGDTLSFRIQEVYRKTSIPYHLNEACLVHGAIIANTLMKVIKKATNYEASAGVGNSKLLAKLACSRNKPQGITIITDISLPRLSKTISFQDLPGFGGAIGEDIDKYYKETLNKEDNSTTTIQNLRHFLKDDLERFVDLMKSLGIKEEEEEAQVTLALDLKNKCEFRDWDQVNSKVFSGTINTSLTFRGSGSEYSTKVNNLAMDMAERINYTVQEWRRMPSLLVLKVEVDKKVNSFPSDNLPLEGKHVESQTIFDFIDTYCRANRLNHRDIIKMHLTGKQIMQVKKNRNV